MSRLVKGLEGRLVSTRDDYPTISRISADCQSTVLKRQSSQVSVIPMPMPIVTLENGLTHCPMSNPVATRTIHRRALDRIYHSIYLTPNWRWIGTCHANRWRIRCQSHVNRQTNPALNLGTSLLLGPTEVSRRRMNIRARMATDLTNVCQLCSSGKDYTNQDRFVQNRL